MRSPGIHRSGRRRPAGVDAAPNGGIQVVRCDARATSSSRPKSRRRPTRRPERARSMAGVRVDAAADKVSADGPQGLDRHESWSVSYRLAVPTPDVAAAEDHQRRHLDRERGRPARVHDGQRRRQAVRRCRRGARPHEQRRRRRGSRRRDLAGRGARCRDEQRRRPTARSRNSIRRGSRPARSTAGSAWTCPSRVQGRIDREIVTNLGAGGPAIRGAHAQRRRARSPRSKAWTSRPADGQDRSLRRPDSRANSATSGTGAGR